MSKIYVGGTISRERDHVMVKGEPDVLPLTKADVRKRATPESEGRAYQPSYVAAFLALPPNGGGVTGFILRD